MPIETPQGNLDIKNATLRTSNLETQNIKIGSIFVGTGNSLEETANVGNSMSNTIQFTNTHTAFTTTGNVEVGGELTVSGNVAVDTDTLFVDSVNDRVGIGTASPEVPFNVVGNNALSGNPNNAIASFRATTAVPGTNDAGVVIGSINGNSPYIADVSTASVGLSFYTQNAERMKINSSGNVGIGTTSPDSSLEVHGTGIHIDGTVLRSYSGVGAMTAGTWYKVCDFSALPATVAGVCAIRIKWGSGYLTNVGTYYWTGYASGIVSYNTYGDGNGTFNGSGVEPLTLNHHYHYRTVGALSFRIDSDASGASYGRHSIYMAPNASIDSMSFEVIAMPLRR